MQIFTIHARRPAPSDGLDPVRDLHVIREGFSWAACVFSALWALWHRLWWEAAAMLGAFVVVGAGAALAFGPGNPAASVATITLAVIIGFTANDLRRRALEADGFDEVGVAAGLDADAALHRALTEEPDLLDPEPPAVQPWQRPLERPTEHPSEHSGPNGGPWS